MFTSSDFSLLRTHFVVRALKATSTFCDIQKENPIRRKQSLILQIDICCRLGKIHPQNRCLGLLLAVMTVFVHFIVRNLVFFERKFSEFSWIFPNPSWTEIERTFSPCLFERRKLACNRFESTACFLQFSWYSSASLATVSIIGAFANFNKHSDDG